MKKGLFLLLVFLLQFSAFEAFSQEFIKEAIISTTPDKVYHIEYLYNEDKVLFGYQKTVESGSALTNVELTTWERGESGLKTKETISLWASNAWKLSQEITYGYDGDGNKIEEILMLANASGVWENSTRTQWTYGDGLLQSVRTDKWQNETWTPQSFVEYSHSADKIALIIFGDYIAGTKNTLSREVFAYNEDGLLDTQTLQDKEPGSDPEVFVNNAQDFFIYADGSEIIKSSQKWNSELGVWEKTVRMESGYDERGILTTQTIQNFGQAWENATQMLYSYDDGGRMITKQYRSWIFTMWLDIFNENYTYDANGNTQLAEFNRMFWTGTAEPEVAEFMPLSYNNSAAAAVINPSQTDLHSAYKIEVEYSDPEDLPVSTVVPPSINPDDNEMEISIYPNPSSDGYFYFNSLEVSLLSYEVYDMSGRKVAARNSNDGYIDLSQVSAGVYNAVLHTKANTVVKKLIRR